MYTKIFFMMKKKTQKFEMINKHTLSCNYDKIIN